MKILLTGGNSVLGKEFVKCYRNMFDIVSPSQDAMDLLDIRSIEKVFSKHRFDAVLHLAGSDGDGQANSLVMFKNIQYIATAHGVNKLIVVGDGAEYGRRPLVDVTEDMIGQVVPTDGYGLGRYLINSLASKDKITTNLRLFDIYGGGARTPINKIVAAAAKGKKNIVIDCDRVVSAVNATDAVKVFAKFLQGNYPKGDYNLVPSDKMSYLQIAKTVKRMAKSDGHDIEIVVKHAGDEYSAVGDKLVSATNAKITTMAKGIKALYEELK
ncbi:MAG: NAD(P)-dependent oxidoreductase [Clostridiales bacterium]|nr:NAD(P)-dependent oxidoreductase [Clostridiales bacterium]